MKPPTPLLEVVSSGADTDPEIERLLHAARESAEPLRENRERVSRALGAALPVSLAALSPAAPSPAALSPAALSPAAGSSAATGATLPAGSVPPAANAVGPVGHAGVGGASGAWLRTGGLLVGSLLLGGLGFWLGHDLGYSKGMAQGLREQLGQGAAHELMHAPRVAEHEPGAPPAFSPSPGLASARTDLAAEKAEPRAPVAPRKHPRPAPADGARRAAHTNERASSAPAADDAGLTFRQVLEQLRRAQQQLRGGQAAMSLLVLSELDRAAGDLLLEEREATRVLALCAVGQDKDARAAARSLEQKNPGSIYSMRLSTSCAGAEASIDDASIDDGNIDDANIDDGSIRGRKDPSLGSAPPE
jgi:hypothetical protein